MSFQVQLLRQQKPPCMVSLQPLSCSPPPHGAVLCVYKRRIIVAGCVSAAGYFVFGGEDMANQTTSHMKGSSRSI